MRRNDNLVIFLFAVLAGIIAVALVCLDGDDAPPVATTTTKPAKSPQESTAPLEEMAEPQRFDFDPNTADSTALRALGLPEYMIRGIYKYRAKGGVYSQPEDVARIPGMTKKMYRELLPHIRISDDYRPAAEMVGERQYTTASENPAMPQTKKLTPDERISLNEADTTILKMVPGVGSYYARQIVNLRERYGGFSSLSQLLEIRNFPESALQYLTIADGSIRKLNINRASFQQLTRHPYIGYERAKKIQAYLRTRGKITSLQEVALVCGFSTDDISRLTPYIEY